MLLWLNCANLNPNFNRPDERLSLSSFRMRSSSLASDASGEHGHLADHSARDGDESMEIFDHSGDGRITARQVHIVSSIASWFDHDAPLRPLAVFDHHATSTALRAVELSRHSHSPPTRRQRHRTPSPGPRELSAIDRHITRINSVSPNQVMLSSPPIDVKPVPPSPVW